MQQERRTGRNLSFSSMHEAANGIVADPRDKPEDDGAQRDTRLHLSFAKTDFSTHDVSNVTSDCKQIETMGIIAVDIPAEIEEKLHAAAELNGITAAELLGKAAAHVAKDYDAYLTLCERQERGKGREAEGLALLRK